MTTYNKATLKTFFQTNDVPDGSDYANLIDSCVNLVETTTQEMAGALSSTEINTALVSAGNGNFTGNVECLTLTADGAATFYGGITAPSGTSALLYNLTVNNNGFITGTMECGGLLTADSGLQATGDVSANTVTVYASAVRSPSGYFGNSVTPIVSAAGTTQGAATVLATSPIVRGQGTADGATTGYAIPANKIGLVQQFVHEGTVSGNLWPPTGGTINALAANAAFALAANTMYTIVHKTASAYAVK
jgi:hypothetical protein